MILKVWQYLIANYSMDSILVKKVSFYRPKSTWESTLAEYLSFLDLFWLIKLLFWLGLKLPEAEVTFYIFILL